MVDGVVAVLEEVVLGMKPLPLLAALGEFWAELVDRRVGAIVRYLAWAEMLIVVWPKNPAFIESRNKRVALTPSANLKKAFCSEVRCQRVRGDKRNKSSGKLGTVAIDTTGPARYLFIKNSHRFNTQGLLQNLYIY